MKLGVREICDVVLKAKSATKIGSHVFQKGEPVCYFDTIKTSSMESNATTVYAQGGAGNSKLLAWEGEKELKFTMEDALISPKGLAILSGADLIQANGKDEDTFVKAHTTEKVEVKEDGKIELKGDPIKDDSACQIYLMLLDGNGEVSGNAVEVDGVKVTSKSGETPASIASDLVKKGDIVMLDYYAKHKTDAVQIEITPDKFGGFYYLEASTLFRRQSDGKDLPAEFIVPKVKIQSNFTFSMASSGDPSSFTFAMDAFPDYTIGNRTKKVLAAIQVLEADDNYDGASIEQDGQTGAYTRYSYNNDIRGSYLNDKIITADDITEPIFLAKVKDLDTRVKAKNGECSGGTVTSEQKKAIDELMEEYKYLERVSESPNNRYLAKEGNSEVKSTFTATKETLDTLASKKVSSGIGG